MIACNYIHMQSQLQKIFQTLPQLLSLSQVTELNFQKDFRISSDDITTIREYIIQSV